MIARGSEIQALVKQGATEALAMFAQQLLEAAVQEAPPSPIPSRDPNVALTLKDTGNIAIEKEAGKTFAVVSFNTPYAAKIHENVRAKHERGGKAKYLEDPLKAMLSEFEGIVAGEVRARLRFTR